MPAPFLAAAGWCDATCEPLTGDASARRYFRLRRQGRSVVLMDATRARESIAPFIRVGTHLRKMGFSAPEILARDVDAGLLLIEDYGDACFARLLDGTGSVRDLFTLAADVLIALHRRPEAAAADLPSYSPEKMLSDLELFLEWSTPGIDAAAREAFRSAWRTVLPLAHRVPSTLLLRDYHVANLMLLPGREGVRRAGLLDFQDAYLGPVTYDLVSLLEDARRDVPEDLRRSLLDRHAAEFSGISRPDYETSLAVIAALRHTRVLGVFDRLAVRDGRSDYRGQHSPRVRRLLQNALRHPALEAVDRWMKHHARLD